MGNTQAAPHAGAAQAATRVVTEGRSVQQKTEAALAAAATPDDMKRIAELRTVWSANYSQTCMELLYAGNHRTDLAFMTFDNNKNGAGVLDVLLG